MEDWKEETDSREIGDLIAEDLARNKRNGGQCPPYSKSLIYTLN